MSQVAAADCNYLFAGHFSSIQYPVVRNNFLLYIYTCDWKIGVTTRWDIKTTLMVLIPRHVIHASKDHDCLAAADGFAGVRGGATGMLTLFQFTFSFETKPKLKRKNRKKKKRRSETWRIITSYSGQRGTGLMIVKAVEENGAKAYIIGRCKEGNLEAGRSRKNQSRS